MAWLAATSLAGGLVFAFAGLLALESSTLQPFALTIDDAPKRLTAGRATKLGLVSAQLGGWFVTPGTTADGSC
jgi:hypothetical protein